MLKNAVTKRYPLSNEKKIHVFERDAEGFYANENTTEAKFVTKFRNTPFKGYYENSGAVQGTCANVEAGKLRSVKRDYETPLDLSGYSCLTVATDVTRFAPGDQYWVTVRLYSDKGVFEGEAPILAECWNTTAFTIGGFDGADSVKSIEIGVKNEGDELWDGLYQIGAVAVGEICDLAFEVPGAWKRFSCDGGKTSFDNGLKFEFENGGSITTPYFPDAHNTKYNAPLDLRNTLFFVLKNESDCKKVRLWFVTDKDGEYTKDKSKEFEIEPDSDFKAYFFNLSDLPTAKDRLAGFKLEMLGGKGSVTVWRVTPEEEDPIYDYAGEVISCISDGQNVAAKMNLKKDGRLRVYETFMYNVFDDVKGLTVLYEADVKAGVNTAVFPFMRGTLTRLTSQFIATLDSGEGEIRVSPRFYIENYKDFASNPYKFDLPDYTVSVLDFGAKADAFTDDTDAIQKAIDDVGAHGGGRVVIPAYNTGRYIITHLLMKSFVDLHIDEGAVLWQSQTDSDYKYKVFYGHDVPMRDINWTHALHVATWPLIYARCVKNIKLTGGGKIRSMDTGSEERRIGWYPNNCQDRIHCISVAFIGVENFEMSDVQIVRANNYHTDFGACKNGYIANVKLHEVKCVSGDGFSFGCGSNHMKVERCFFESNDDAIVMTSSYNDPRGILWWWATPGMINAPHDIEVAHCYLNSGGGKAICFITWGSDDPITERTEIYNINVYDCILQGGYAVGTWPDNPYNGKMPFDNTETDDWSPVKNVHIFNNEYRSPTDLLCIKPTNFLSDTPIKSASYFQNSDFTLGRTFWTEEGDVWFDKNCAYVGAGRLYQGLYLEKGKHTLTVTVKGKGRVFAEDALDFAVFAEDYFDEKEKTDVKLDFELKEDTTVALGIFEGIIYNARVE